MSGIQIGLGEITDINVSNFMRIAAVAGPGNAAYDRFLSSLIDKSDGALKGVTDPIEKILSAVFTHVQEKGLSGEFLNKYNRFTEAIDSGEKMSGASKSFYDALHRGQFIYNATDLPSPARVTPAAAPAAPTPPPAAPTPPPAAVPPPVAQAPAASTSNLRGTLVEKTKPTTNPIKMDMYHGGFGLDDGFVDPAKHSSGRTPLPALTVSDEATARRYATTGGPIGGLAGGNTYKLGLEFDSPERIVRAFDPASDDFINFMRNSLPEEGIREPLVPGGKPGVARYREIFDKAIGSMPEDDKTFYSVMDAVSNIHETYRPLGEYDYVPRAQGSIEAKRFGIDALTWIDHGDEAMGLLDPHDVRSKTGRVNIRSLDNITETSTDELLSTTDDVIDTVDRPLPLPVAPTPPPDVSPSSAPAAPSAQAATASSSDAVKPNFKYYNDPNYNPDIFFGDNEHTVKAFHPDTGEEMGRLSFYGKDAITPGEIDKIEVAEKFRRQGVATGLLEEARRLSTVDENIPYVVHSKSRTPDGDAWAKSTGDVLPEKISSASPDPTAPPPATKTATDTPSTRSTLKVGGTTDVRTQPKARGTDGASGGKVTPSGTAHTVADTKDLTTKNTNPKTTTPKAQAKVVSQDVASTAERIKPATNRPSRVTTKGKDLVDNGLRTAQDLAGGNARLMGIAAAAGLLGLGVAATRKKNQPRAEADTTYLADSRRRMQY